MAELNLHPGKDISKLIYSVLLSTLYLLLNYSKEAELSLLPKIK